MNPSNDSQFRIESCIPDKPQIFVGRDIIVKQIISALVEDGCGIVSIVGGPGFGKSTAAVEVSHQLSNEHDIVVIFSFMSHASTVSEVRLRLCHDVGVNPGEDPKSSLMFWLRSVKKKVVLVMDNIEQLLESDVKSQFVELMLTLRKNSHQYIQILTTSRTKFSIPGQTSINHEIEELDEKSSVELLRKCCLDEVSKDAYFSELATLCGFVPLALCITGTLIPDLDDPSELIQWLREKPMQALRNSDQCVQQAIEFSFQKLSDEDRRGLVCLSVFGGNFQKKSAEEVTEKDGIKTQGLLRNLVNRSLVQKSSGKRYVIHSLIRRFLADHDQFQDEKAMAQALMVRYFLKMCHLFTMDCYSFNGFTSARESLKKDIHNLEETFKICSQDQALPDGDSKVAEFLANSDIYKSSYRFFHNFSWDLLTETVLTNFSESCIQLAERRQQQKIKIAFQYQVAAQEGHNSGWKSTAQEYSSQIEKIEAEFYKNKAVLKEDRYLYMSCYHIVVRYYYSKEPNSVPVDLTEDDLPPIPENKVLTPIEKAAEAHTLMKRGNLGKIRANVLRENKEKFNEFMDFAKSSYNQALSLAEEVLGDHELTCALNKLLGDLCSNLRKNDEALKYYTHAINLHKKLKFDSNEQFVTLLKNCGACLSYLQLFDDSMKMLMEALDIADKLAEKPTHCKALVYCQLAVTCSYWRRDCQEATKFAEEAMKMRELLDPRYVKTLEKIIQRAEDNAVVQDIIKLLPHTVCVQDSCGKTRLRNCIPDRESKFTGRCTIVKQIISSLVEDGCKIVSVVGGPGYGKSTVAVEVSHSLSDEHDIVVIFSCLSHASTIPEVITRLCLDVGVNPGNDPESSLMFWLKSIEKKVVLVMDSIEQLLERNVKSQFHELVLSLRKNSQQRLQILMTSRTGFVIPEQITVNHQIEELNEKSSIELLRKCCPDEEIKNAYMSELANLCGFVPFALCIIGTLIPDLDDPLELIQWLKECPMETSKNSDQCVQQAIELSFEKLSDENRKALVCLSVFDGDFETNHAQEVMERSELETVDTLKYLVSRSLIQSGSDRRFVIHSLIRRFLVDHDKFKAERKIAQGLMVAHFLKTCHLLTMDCYSYNGFTSAKESLKKNIHNVEETFRICSQDQTTNLNRNIHDLLTSSDIYKSSSRFFYIFSWELLPETVLKNFFESCIELAKSRKQPAIEIAFRCLVAVQEGHKSAWKSPEYNDRMNDIAKTLKKSEAVLKDDRLLFMLCHYIFSRFDSDKEPNAAAHPNLLEDDLPLLHKNETPCQIEKAAEAYFLMECGNLNKKLFLEDKEKSNEYLSREESYYNQALSVAKEFLGDHELTCILYKLLGDLYSKMRNNKEALAYYVDAINLRKKLELDANEAFVFLLKNLGTCLSYLGRHDQSVGTLKNARDIAEKLADKKTPCRARVCFVLAVTYHKWKPGCQQATEYAKEAMEMHELLDSHMVKTLEKIIQTVEKGSVV